MTNRHNKQFKLFVVAGPSQIVGFIRLSLHRTQKLFPLAAFRRPCEHFIEKSLTLLKQKATVFRSRSAIFSLVLRNTLGRGPPYRQADE